MNVCLDQLVRDFRNSLETQFESMTPDTVLNNKSDHVDLSNFSTYRATILRIAACFMILNVLK